VGITTSHDQLIITSSSHYSLFSSKSSRSSSSSSNITGTTTKQPGAEFLARVRYENPLPELPFAPKLRPSPLDSSSYSDYQRSATWLKRVEQPLLGDSLMCMPVDFVDQRGLMERRRAVVPLDERDAPLMSLPFAQNALSPKSAQLPSSSKITWLRRTEYISGEGSRLGRHKGRGQAPPPSSSVDVDDLVDGVNADPSDDLALIEGSFTAANQPLTTLRHPKNPSLKAVEEYPVMPDVQSWPTRLVHAVFEDDPSAEQSLSKPRSRQTPDELAARTTAEQCLEASFLKPVQSNAVSEEDKKHHQMMIHFVPTAEELQTADTFHCTALRKYNFQLHSNTGDQSTADAHEKHQQKIVLVLRPTGKTAVYKELPAKVVLRKRRSQAQHHHRHHRKQRSRSASPDRDPSHPTDLTVARRAMNDDERKLKEEMVGEALGV
jgi:RNA polymerase II-associated factor 1